MRTVGVETRRDGHVGEREEHEANAHEYAARPVVLVEPFALSDRVEAAVSMKHETQLKSHQDSMKIKL